jgi:hypothetical protein
MENLFACTRPYADKCSRNISTILANKRRPLRKINVEQHNVHTSTETCQARETYLSKLVVQGEGKT